jgi:hypothetical protein
MAMYSRTILLAAASLAVTGMDGSADAQSMNFRQPIVAREQVLATLNLHHHRLLSDPHFVRGHYVARSLNPVGRVVLVEINPKDGGWLGEVLI